MKNFRINDEELYFDEEIMHYNGVPFTGVSLEYYKCGALHFETLYKNGLQDGLSTEYFENGAKKEEIYWSINTPFRYSREWYKNGKQKSLKVGEKSVNIYEVEWNENGELIGDKLLKKSDPYFEILMIERNS